MKRRNLPAASPETPQSRQQGDGDRPIDVLSDTLRVVRLSGAVFLNAIFTSPWSIETVTPAELAASLRLPSDCIALFHIVVQGQCWLAIPGYAPVLLAAGDAILIPHSAPHVITSDLHVTPIPITSILQPPPPDALASVIGGGLGETTQFVCGFLHCDQRFNPLIGALPELIVIHPGESERNDGQRVGQREPTTVLAVQPGDWLETTMRHTVTESLGGGPGNSDMLARLCEILFFEVVRRYMQQLPAAHPGWLAGVRDPIVGQVLRLLHAHPGHPWTVEELARAVAVSRSTLADRFTTLVGETPMRYLAAWRMQLAQHLLKYTTLNLAEVAGQVGYESDVAFNRAFKRHVGQPPATWRVAG